MITECPLCREACDLQTANKFHAFDYEGCGCVRFRVSAECQNGKCIDRLDSSEKKILSEKIRAWSIEADKKNKVPAGQLAKKEWFIVDYKILKKLFPQKF